MKQQLRVRQMRKQSFCQLRVRQMLTMRRLVREMRKDFLLLTERQKD